MTVGRVLNGRIARPRARGRLVFVFSLAAALLSGCASPEPRRSPAENAAVFDAAWTKIAERHYDANLGGVDWNGVKERVRPKAEAAKTDDELRAALAELTGSLGHSHVSIFKPGENEPETAAVAEERAAAKSSSSSTSTPNEGGAAARSGGASEGGEASSMSLGRGYFGARAVAAGDDLVISGVEKGSPAEKAGVEVGDVVVSVDGRSAAELFARLQAREGKKWRGSAPYAFSEATSGPIGGKKALVLRAGDGAVHTATGRLAPPRSAPIDFGLLGSFPSEFETRRLEGGALYARFTPCYPTVVDRLSKALDAAPDATGVILDLRGNPGGFGATASGVARFFLDVEAELGVMKLREDEMRFIAYPAPNAFKGPLVVLVDEATGSTAEILAAGLKDLGRARIVGRTTMGAALPSVVEELPGGWRLLTVVADFTTASGTRVEGLGVVPDVAVELSADAFSGGVDPDVQAALAALASAPTIETWNKPAPTAAPAAASRKKRDVEADAEATAWMGRWIEALGGEAALRREATSRTTARVEVMGLKFETTTLSDGAGKIRIESSMGALGNTLQVVNDEGVFEASTLQGVRSLDGGEAALVKRSAQKGGEAAWRDVFAKVEHLGVRQVDGADYVVLRRTPHEDEGEPETIFLDPKTALPVRTEMKIKSKQATIQATSVVDEWGEYGGVKTPKRTTTTLSKGVKMTTTVLKVEHGVEIPEDAFEKPTSQKKQPRPTTRRKAA
jgi:carboxyl-terminal processing protease